MKKQQLAILKKNVNIGGLLADELDLVLEPALQKVVDDSANPFDNMLMASVYPTLEKYLKDEIEKRVNQLFEAEEDEAAV